MSLICSEYGTGVAGVPLFNFAREIRFGEVAEKPTTGARTGGSGFVPQDLKHSVRFLLCLSEH